MREIKTMYSHTLRLFESEENILRELMKWSGVGVKHTVMIVLREKFEALRREGIQEANKTQRQEQEKENNRYIIRGLSLTRRGKHTILKGRSLSN